MKIKYIGKSFGTEGLTNNKVYECLGIEGDYNEFVRVVDDSEEDYLYSISQPGDLDNTELNGKWEIVEDDEKGTLAKYIK